MAGKPKRWIEVPESERKAESARQAIFDGWLAECDSLHEAVIEGLLANLPSLDGE